MFHWRISFRGENYRALMLAGFQYTGVFFLGTCTSEWEALQLSNLLLPLIWITLPALAPVVFITSPIITRVLLESFRTIKSFTNNLQSTFLPSVWRDMLLPLGGCMLLMVWWTTWPAQCAEMDQEPERRGQGCENRAQGGWNTEKWCLIRSILMDLGKKQQKFRPAVKILNVWINIYKECTAKRFKEMDVACNTCRSKSSSS